MLTTTGAQQKAYLARAFALTVDKTQLLEGGATGRVELSESEIRAGVQRLRDELAARRERKVAAGRRARRA